MSELMLRLGHSTSVMAMRYQHATKERDRAIAEKLGARFGATEKQEPEERPTAIAGG